MPKVTTPIRIIDELGILDKIYGHVVPFNMQFNVHKLLEIPTVKYIFNNSKSIEQWSDYLGDKHGQDTKTIKCIKRYRDMTLGRYIEQGEILMLNCHRATEIIESGYATEV